MTAKTICFALQKGGVTKTTLCRHVGHSIAKQGKRVLMVDLDPQHSLTSVTGVTPVGSMSDVIGTVEAGNRAIIDIIQSISENLDIAPASTALAQTESGLVIRRAREYVLQKALTPVQGRYDYILIDCPPALGLLLSNALIASQWVIVPLTPEPLSLESLTLFLETLEAMQEDYPTCAKLLGTVATRVDTRTVLTKETIESLQARDELRMFDTLIPHTIRFNEAALMKEPLHEYEPGHAAAQALDNLTQEILERG